MKALILAGGKGTRLQGITKNEIPKSLVEICGKKIIEYTIEQLKEYGIKEIYISVGFLHEKIENFLKDGKDFGVNIHYIIETKPLGSGGAMYYLKDKIIEDFLVIPGDIIFNIDFNRMIDFHKSHNALITLFSHPNLHPYDSDLVIVDNDNRVIEINRKNSVRNFYYKNNVNAGIFVMSSKVLDYFTEPKEINIEHDLVEFYIPSHKVFAYKSTEYIKDVGTLDRFALAKYDTENHIVENKNLKHKQKAIFLDRDGTINKYKGFIRDEKDIELIDNVDTAIKKINNSGYLAIIISNQPVIARGECSFEMVNTMFNKIETLLGKSGAYIDGIYYCPHHPKSGFDGEIKELKIDCTCRKPKTGLIEKACKDFNLDLSKCIMIGDSILDILTAENAKIKSIKLKSMLNETETTNATFYAKDLLEAVNIILAEK